MDNDYYNYIYYFAFENLIKCEKLKIKLIIIVIIDQMK